MCNSVVVSLSAASYTVPSLNRVHPCGCSCTLLAAVAREFDSTCLYLSTVTVTHFMSSIPCVTLPAVVWGHKMCQEQTVSPKVACTVVAAYLCTYGVVSHLLV